MNSRIWGIIGGVALVIALLSPLVLGNANKIKQLFEEAEVLYEREDYEAAITKYSEALRESKKIGAKTERIDTDFTTLANLKIAWCYYALAEKTSDVRHNKDALIYIREVASDTQIPRYQEELTYLWADNLYKIGDLNQATSKFTELIEKFPQSRWVPNALYAMAEIAYQQENCEKSLNTFQKLVTEFPQSELTQKAEHRIVELNELCNPPPPVPIPPCEEMYKRASDLQQRGENYDAHELYTDLISQCPESEYVIDAYVRKAEIHLDAKNYVKARANYEEAIYSTTDAERKRELYAAYHRTYLVPVYPNPVEKTPPDTDELFAKARLLWLEKRWLEAAETYEQLTNRNLPVEDMVYALYWAGRCYYEASQTDSTLFSKLVDTSKRLTTDYENSQYDIEAYYYLALAYTEWAKASGDQSKWQLVIETVKKANTKYGNTDDPAVQEWLGRMQPVKDTARDNLHPRKRAAENAIKTTENAIDLAKEKNEEPQLIQKANEILEDAKEHMPRGEYEEATSKAKKACEIIKQIPIPPPSPKDYVDQGYIHLGKGELEEATHKAQQALNLDRNYSPAHELKSKIRERYSARGRRHFEEEKYDEAIEAFRNAININIHPKLKEPYNYLGVIYIGQENYREAIAAFSDAVRIDADFKEAYFNRALAHLELAEFEAAIDNAEAALRIDPNYEPARMLIEFIAN